MTGEEHYTESERLLEAYKAAWLEVEQMPIAESAQIERRLFAADGAKQLLTKAAIHADLAQAAMFLQFMERWNYPMRWSAGIDGLIHEVPDVAGAGS